MRSIYDAARQPPRLARFAAAGPRLGNSNESDAMKIACSSVSFARALAEGKLTQLEWLDLCANELEVDGAVFDTAQFPRQDDEYLSQLKKQAADLGLTVAAVSSETALSGSGIACLEIASRMGAPLVAGKAPPASDDPAAWGHFCEALRVLAGAAKAANITLGVRNAPGTLCASVADLRRLAKDVDSAWLRFAPEPASFGATDDAGELLAKSVIAFATIEQLETFALAGDRAAAGLVSALARFRAFIVLDSTDLAAPRDAYHRALERFAALRSTALETNSFN
jgi:hypothetical protein